MAKLFVKHQPLVAGGRCGILTAPQIVWLPEEDACCTGCAWSCRISSSVGIGFGVRLRASWKQLAKQIYRDAVKFVLLKVDIP